MCKQYRIVTTGNPPDSRYDGIITKVEPFDMPSWSESTTPRADYDVTIIEGKDDELKTLAYSDDNVVVIAPIYQPKGETA